MSESTVRRAAATQRERAMAGAPAAHRLEPYKGRLLQELEEAWASYEARKPDLKPAQRVHEVRALADLQRTIERATVNITPVPASLGEAELQHDGAEDDDLIAQLAAAAARE